DNVDLSGVAVIDPQLTLLPQIEANGMMRIAGFFSSVPAQVDFVLAYPPVGGGLRLFRVSVSFCAAAPGPAPPPSPPPPPGPGAAAPQAAAPPAPKPNPSGRPAAPKANPSDRPAAPKQ